MSDYTRTPNFNLYKPVPNADFDIWGDHLNANADTIDTVLAGFETRFSTSYDLRDFGAMCDGVTDDAWALQAAIAAVCGLPTGGKIIVPEGRTVIGSAITYSVPAGVAMVIEGMGPGTSELYFSNATDGLSFMLLNSGTAWGACSLHALTVTRGPGLAYPDPSWAANTGIKVYADPTVPHMCSSHMSFRDLNIGGSNPGVNQWLNSMVLTGITGTSLDNVHIIGRNARVADDSDVQLTISGVLVGGTFSQYSTSINIVNCGFNGGSVGILITGYVQGVFVSNTTVIGQYDSIRWAGTSIVGGEELAVANSTFNGVSHGVYIVYCNQCSITGTTILRFKPSPGTLPNFAGIEINNSAFCSVVGNNIIGGAIGPAADIGIVLSDCGQSINTVVGNIVTQYVTPGSGIYMTGTTSSAVVIGNAMTTPNGGGIGQDTEGNIIYANSFNHSPSVWCTPVTFADGLTSFDTVTSLSGFFLGGTVPGNNVVLFNDIGTGTPAFATPVAASGNSYTTATGVVVLTTTTAHGIAASTSFTLYGATGTGSFANLQGSWTATAVTSTTITFTGPIGLGAVTITGGNVKQSLGLKIQLLPTASSTAVDYGIGYGGNAIWMSAPQNVPTNHFDWYGGITKVATLDGTGVLTIAGQNYSTVPRNAANDAAAAALVPPVPVGGVYRNGSALMVRVV